MEVKPRRTLAALMLAAVGVALAILGVALIYFPAALILLGVALAAIGFFGINVTEARKR